MDWTLIAKTEVLTEDFIETFEDKLCWSSIKYQRLSEPFIEKHLSHLYWVEICSYQTLSESFMEKYINGIYWAIISQFQWFSYEFTLRHIDKIRIFRFEKNKKVNFTLQQWETIQRLTLYQKKEKIENKQTKEG